MTVQSEPRRYLSAEDVEAAFYDALARADLEALMEVWSDDEEVVCIAADGTRAVGLPAVRAYWQRLFDAQAGQRLQVTRHIATLSVTMAFHHITEEVAPQASAPPQRRAVSLLYVRGALGWRLALYHVSPTPDPAVRATTDQVRVVH